MAKQNVSFVERHVEKVILGACGAVLLGVAAFWLVQTPNTVTINGTSLGPSEFYKEFPEQGKLVLQKMQQAKAKRGSEDAPTVVSLGIESPLKLAELPPRLPVAFVPPSPPIPNLDELPTGGAVELVEILPPSKPIASTGRSLARLPDPQVDTVGSMSPAAVVGSTTPLSRDCTWVTLVGTINRKAQRERFEAAKYAADRLALIVAAVEAERQEQLPSGGWGPSEKVQAYAGWSVVGPTSVSIAKNGADAEIAPNDWTLIDEYHRKLAEPTAQGKILRPDFQSFLDDWWMWTTPRKLPDMEVEMSECGVHFLEETTAQGKTGVTPPTPKVGPPPRAPTTPPRGMAPPGGFGRGGRGAPPTGSRMPPGPTESRSPNRTPRPPGETANPAAAGAMKQVMELQKQAEAAINKDKDYLKAEQLLQQILSNSQAPDVARDKAQKLLDDYRTDIEQAHRDEELKLQAKETAKTWNFGPDIDPIWVNDTGLTPGKTYRYRMRLNALNQYAGQVRKVKNLEDAGKVTLTGQWSEWSEPIFVEGDKQIFFAGLGQKAGTVKAFAWQYQNGKWNPASADLGVGASASLGQGKAAVNCDATVLDIDFKRPYKQRDQRPDGVIDYRDAAETQAVILVNSRGEVQEHLVPDDMNAKREFDKRRQKERKDKEAAGTQQPGFDTQPRNRMPMGPMMPMGPGGMMPMGPGGMMPRRGGADIPPG